MGDGKVCFARLGRRVGIPSLKNLHVAQEP